MDEYYGSDGTAEQTAKNSQEMGGFVWFVFYIWNGMGCPVGT